MGRDPSIVGMMTDPTIPSSALFQKYLGRIVDFDKPSRLHLEDGDFIRRAKAVFHHPDHAVVVLLVPFKVQNSVDKVFQNARTGNLS